MMNTTVQEKKSANQQAYHTNFSSDPFPIPDTRIRHLVIETRNKMIKTVVSITCSSTFNVCMYTKTITDCMRPVSINFSHPDWIWFLIVENCVKKCLDTNQVAHHDQARAYFAFCSMKQPRIFLLPPRLDAMPLSACRVLPLNSPAGPFVRSGWKGTARVVFHPMQEHNTDNVPIQARTQTVRLLQLESSTLSMRPPRIPNSRPSPTPTPPPPPPH